MMRRCLSFMLGAGVLTACGDSPVDVAASAPVIAAVTPAQGTAGTELRIEGSGFQPGATVRIGAASSPSVDLEGGVLFAAAPADVASAAGTAYDVVVRNPDGGTATLAAAFTPVAPGVARVNGVIRPTGLQGMTVIIEGSAFGDDPVLSQGRVWFENRDGSDLAAVVEDPANDWTDSFIVTAVPQGVSDTSWIRVETVTGVSQRIEFRLIQSGTFSPSVINWTATTPLLQPLQGLGAVFVPVEDGPDPANHVFVLAGADTQNVATDVVHRARILQTGELEASWAVLTPIPAARAYHATAAATAFTAALDTTTTAAYLYVAGGRDAEGATVSTIFVGHVDLAGNVTGWATTRSLPQPLHGARALVFRGFLYVTGGAGADGVPVATVYRAPIAADGTLGDWSQPGDLPGPTAFHALANFGPFLYVMGGDSAAVDPVRATLSNGEVQSTRVGRINLRNGDLTAAGWSATNPPPKQRSKHSMIFAGGYLFVTSGIYSGQAGSSENVYGKVLNDGSVESWNGATGVNTIRNRLGYDLYNQAAVSFIDAAGRGRVLVLGGAKRASEGEPSAAVVFY
jgi:hypothetical protein